MDKQQTDASLTCRAWWTRAIAVSFFTLASAVIWPLSTKADDSTFIVAASQITWGDGVDLKEIGCLTLNRKVGNHISKIDHSDDPQIVDLLRKYFPNKEISPNDPSCHYVLTFLVTVSDTHAVKYAGQISRMLMTFSVIEKNPYSGSLYYEGMRFKGDYKDLYLFRSDLKPVEAFEVGLKAFVAPQVKKWEVMRVSLNETR